MGSHWCRYILDSVKPNPDGDTHLLCTLTFLFVLTLREFVMELQGNFLVVNHIQIGWK